MLHCSEHINTCMDSELEALLDQIFDVQTDDPSKMTDHRLLREVAILAKTTEEEVFDYACYRVHVNMNYRSYFSTCLGGYRPELPEVVLQELRTAYHLLRKQRFNEQQK